MLDSQHTKWLMMLPNVFVDIIDDSLMLLYNTHGGIIKISRDEKLINLIKMLYAHINLGVVKYEILDKYNSHDIDWALKNGVISFEESDVKPIIYLPILNLQKDINKFNDNGIESRLQLIGSKLKYISGAFIRLSNMRDKDTSLLRRLRSIAATQHPCPSYEDSTALLTLDQLRIIIDNLKLTSVATIDIIFSGNYLERYSCEELVGLLSKYNFAYRVHLYSEDYETIVTSINKIDIKLNLSFIVYQDRFSINDKSYIFNSAYHCEQKYLVYNEQDIMSNKGDSLPVWTGNNQEMFSKYVYTELSDLEESKINFNTLFRNQKLNSNFFGLIDIAPDGNVYAHGSKQSIGNVNDKEFSLVDVVINEFKENRTWRLTRDCTKCKLCPFRFVCPPVSIFEIQSNQIKMCHINYNEL